MFLTLVYRSESLSHTTTLQLPLELSFLLLESILPRLSVVAVDLSFLAHTFSTSFPIFTILFPLLEAFPHPLASADTTLSGNRTPTDQSGTVLFFLRLLLEEFESVDSEATFMLLPSPPSTKSTTPACILSPSKALTWFSWASAEFSSLGALL